MFSVLSGLACSKSSADLKTFPDPVVDLQIAPDAGPQTIVLAGGCFWCTEGVFQQIPGVTKIVSGYSGGAKETANYDAVCGGDTGHAEAIAITFDPAKVTYGHLLKAFFAVAHDPTTLNRQGNDAGTQYRSAIFYANEDQKRVATAYIKQLDDAKVYPSKIVTTLEPLVAFYPGEAYHQNYVNLHPNQPYIVGVALEKVAKAKKFAAMPATKPAESSVAAPATQP